MLPARYGDILPSGPGRRDQGFGGPALRRSGQVQLPASFQTAHDVGSLGTAPVE